ncbi:MAG: substrate-binding domain-containing protein [Brevinema sp.]
MRKVFYGIVLCLFALGACGKAASGDKIKIGVTTWDYADQWASYLFDAIRDEAAKNPNVELTVLDAKGDSGVQLSQVENFVTTGMDAIIILPTDRSSFGNAAKVAKDAGIPVAVANRLPLEKDFPLMDVYVGIVEKEAGVLGAKHFISNLQAEGRINEDMEIGILWGPPGLDAVTARTDGVKETLAEYPNLRVTREQTARWDRGPAVTIVENWLQADTGNKIKAIFANNDEMAIGASLAIRQSRRANDDIRIYGIDAIPAGIDAIGNGLTATVEQDPVAMGSAVFKAAYQLAQKEPLTGLVDGKYVWIDLNLIDASNKEAHLEKIAAREAK